ncbi:MAG: hypothetical protein ACYC55_07295 [Candidatus Geothermincolia bacterium]
MHTVKVRKITLGFVLASLLLGSVVVLAMLLAQPGFAPEAHAYGRGYMGARYWLFAEGTTRPGFEEWILLFNPPAGPGSGMDAHYTVDGFDQNGAEHGLTAGTLMPGQRASINVNAIVGNAIDISVYVQSDQPIIAERALYFSYQGLGHEPWTGGCSVMGYSEPQLDVQP